MKCILLAAGRGIRLRPYTDSIPKCLLPFQGIPLIQYLVSTMRSCGIEDIIIVRGYLGERLNLHGVRYVEDHDGFNMLHSLFRADSELRGNIVVSYADIIYERRVLEELLRSQEDVSVVIDTEWESYYRERVGDPYLLAESLVLDGTRIISIGMPVRTGQSLPGQYIGLMKYSPEGIEKLRVNYWKARQQFWGKQWRCAERFELAYMTDMLQELIDNGVNIHAVPVRHGWLEFDTSADYEKVLAWDQAGTLGHFLDISGLVS